MKYYGVKVSVHLLDKNGKRIMDASGLLPQTAKLTYVTDLQPDDLRSDVTAQDRLNRNIRVRLEAAGYDIATIWDPHDITQPVNGKPIPCDWLTTG